MMLEDKKRVAKWMGAEYWKDDPENEDYELRINKRFTSFGFWNPQDDKKATFAEWEEIWSNMTVNQRIESDKTGSPSEMWRDLIEMIKE